MNSDRQPGESDRTAELIGLGVVLILGLVLRLRHLDTLLPWFYYVDELRTVEYSLRLINNRTIDTGYQFYPALSFYINAAAYMVWAVAGQAAAVLKHGPGVALEMFRGMQDTDLVLLMLSRWVSVLFGLAALVYAHLVARQFLPWRWALFATLLWSINTLHVSMCGLAKADSINSFFLIAGFYYASVYLRRGGTRYLVTTCALAGLSFAVKNYYFLVIWVSFLLIVKGLEKGEGLGGLVRHRETWAGFLIMLLAGFIGSPYTFIKLKETMINVGWLYRQAEIISTWHTDPHAWWRDRHFYAYLIILPFIFGLPLYLATVAGCVNHARKWALKDPTILYALIWFLHIFNSQAGGPSGSSYHYYLYMYIIPFGIIMAVELGKDMVSSPAPWRAAAGYAIIAVVLVTSLLRIQDYRKLMFENYDLAGPWIRERLGPRSRLLMLSVYKPSKALGVAEARSVWPQEFDEKLIASFDPDVIVIDTWVVAGFRKYYKPMRVEGLVDSILAGDKGYNIVANFRPDYLNRWYYVALDPEHDVELVVLKREKTAPETKRE
ncbi:MAG TPA: glycosyltransferase family 39 protein [bacterium]|nr:glycosyltransferase family 39 protein [bacterium]